MDHWLLPPTVATAAERIAGPRAPCWCPARPSASFSSSSSSSSSSPSSSTARAVTRMGPMFRAPATTNGAICLSSRSRPPQHFASHLPRSFLRPSSPIVLPLLLLLPLLPSLRCPSLSATSSSSWSVGRSTFRPLCRLHHHRVSSPLSAFLFFSSFLFQPVPPRFTFDGESTPPRRPLSSSTFTTSERRSPTVDRSCWQECAKLVASPKNTQH